MTGSKQSSLSLFCMVRNWQTTKKKLERAMSILAEEGLLNCQQMPRLIFEERSDENATETVKALTSTHSAMCQLTELQAHLGKGSPQR